MVCDEKKFDITGIGIEVKARRQALGMTQEDLAQYIDRTSRTIMNIENRGQHPSLDSFLKLVTYLNISVDEFLYGQLKSDMDARRRRINSLLNSMSDNELAIIEATAESICKNRVNR